MLKFQLTAAGFLWIFFKIPKSVQQVGLCGIFVWLMLYWIVEVFFLSLKNYDFFDFYCFIAVFKSISSYRFDSAGEVFLL